MFEKPLRMLGLATKAGKVITGAELSQKADRDGKAKLIIIAKDAKYSTKKEFCNAKSPVIEFAPECKPAKSVIINPLSIFLVSINKNKLLTTITHKLIRLIIILW